MTLVLTATETDTVRRLIATTKSFSKRQCRRLAAFLAFLTDPAVDRQEKTEALDSIREEGV